LGAAYLAGLAAGYWQDLSDLARQRQGDRIFTPMMPAEEVAHLRAGWRKAVERAKGWQEP